MDCLELLRTAIIAGQELVLENAEGQVLEGDALAAAAADNSGDAPDAEGAGANEENGGRDAGLRMRLPGLAPGQEPPPLSSDTYFKSQKGTGPFYTLGQVWRLYFHRDLSHGKYLATIGGTGVSYVDRKELLGYLTGKVKKSRSVKKPAAKAQVPPVAPAAPIAESTDAPTSDSVETGALVTGTDQSADAGVAEMEVDAKESGGVVPPTTAAAVASVEEGSKSTAKSDGSSISAAAAKSKAKSESRKKTASGGAAATDARSYVPPKYAVVDVPKDIGREVLARELPLHSRKSVLRTTGTKRIGKGVEVPFFRPLVDQIQYINAVDREIEQRAKLKSSGSGVTYDRYNPTDKFWKERIGKDAGAMNLEAGGGLADVAKMAATTGDAAVDAAAGAVDAAAGAAAAAVEQAAAAAVSSSTDAPASKKRASDAGDRSSGSKKRASGDSGSGAASNPLTSAPILIVPPAAVANAPLCIRNIGELLEKGRYQPAGSTAVPGERSMFVVHRGGSGAAFDEAAADSDRRVTQLCIVSGPRLLNEAAWSRVVGVITHGADWQFKGWRISRPVELFSRVRGFYVRFDDQKTPPLVKQWNVKELVLARNNRHTDQKLAQLLWNEIDMFNSRK